MRLLRARVRDFRSVGDDGVDLPLDGGVLALVGPNLAGKSNVARALAAALDPRVGVDPAVDGPLGSDAQPTVALAFDLDGREVLLDVGWPAGRRRVFSDGPLPQEAGDVHYVPPPDSDAAAPGPQPSGSAVTTADDHGADEPGAAHVLATVQRVTPDVEQVAVEAAGLRARDRWGGPVRPELLRVPVAIARARARHAAGRAVAAVIVDTPEAGLHPSAQEALQDLLAETALLIDAPVVVATSSRFLLPRGPRDAVLTLGRDVDGATWVVSRVPADEFSGA